MNLKPSDKIRSDNTVRFPVNPDYEHVRYGNVFHNTVPPTDPLYNDPYTWYIDRKFPQFVEKKIQAPEVKKQDATVQVYPEVEVKVQTRDVMTQFPPSCCYPFRSTPCCDTCERCRCSGCCWCFSVLLKRAFCVLSCGLCFSECCAKKGNRVEPKREVNAWM